MDGNMQTRRRWWGRDAIRSGTHLGCSSEVKDATPDRWYASQPLSIRWASDLRTNNHTHKHTRRGFLPATIVSASLASTWTHLTDKERSSQISSKVNLGTYGHGEWCHVKPTLRQGVQTQAPAGRSPSRSGRAGGGRASAARPDVLRDPEGPTRNPFRS
ncbi:hypothetical protein LZ32DRAFT_188673 [Colletotrichum eremochloae]|nr:hypothetical protein LZ32DRAFT_188673 [Colletotrichum eremochloae]